MRLIDFHCDTPTALYRAGRPFAACRLQANPADTADFAFYLQCAACFTPRTVGDADGMAFANAVFDTLFARVAELPDGAIVTSAAQLQTAVSDGKRAFLPTVEDLRIINGDLAALDALRARGVRIGTLVWRDQTALGGAWNTHAGLSPFGKAAVERMLALGILPDVSHASHETFYDVAERCRAMRKPFLATHSNAFACCAHPRNLDDAQLRAVAQAGGVIGLNLYPPFLAGDTADIADLARHIAHIVGTAGQGAIVLGTDFDGVDALPCGISGVCDLPALFENLKKQGFSAALLDRLFFENGYRFLTENL